ncbi:MAG: hypothetical protein NWF05_11505 [Candidatus Bathyarchaeota archaeon]|nr:hypothetical protein [Candidatus Bathyarchaeota archaeon]
MVQKTESKVDVYTSRHVQLIPINAVDIDSKPSSASAVRKKKQADEPLYIDRI